MRKRSVFSCLTIIITLVITISCPIMSLAASNYEFERITNFHSDIVINADGTMNVTENIEVYSAGREIRRGIYRDFPTKYRDRFGNKYVVGFEITKVLREGLEEPYHIKNLANGKRIYIGSEDRLLPTGKHKYSISYTTNRQLGYFESHDELYWNVIGLGWDFPVEIASATITLPSGISKTDIELDGYTGPEGSTQKNFVASFDEAGKPTFSINKPLMKNEGLTIVVKWPKGFVTEPTFLAKAVYFFRDNIVQLVGIIAFIIVLIYYLYIWNKVGRDPEKGTIIPLFEPPKGLSPAALRYIRRMSFDNKAFTAAVLNMAVRGYLKISEAGRTYSLRRGDKDDTVLEIDEKDAARTLIRPEFGEEYVVELKQKNHTIIKGAMSALKDSLATSYKKLYFITNSKYITYGFLLSFAALLVPSFINAASISPLFIVIAISHILIHIVFATLLKAPTDEGRRIMDDIEGFRMFLSVTEKERLNLLNPPEKTPELFERFLPYALALDVENQWAKQFADVFKRIADAGQEYKPGWYYGTRWNMMNIAAFAPSFTNSFSGAIASSSTPPGSSSGFGGGGFSGGGGGGGGGGGW